MKTLRIAGMSIVAIVALIALIAPLYAYYMQSGAHRQFDPQQEVGAEIEAAALENKRLWLEAQRMTKLSEDDIGTIVEKTLRIGHALQRARGWHEDKNLPESLRYLNAAQKEISQLESFLKRRRMESANPATLR